MPRSAPRLPNGWPRSRAGTCWGSPTARSKAPRATRNSSSPASSADSARDPEVVVVGEGLERGEVGLELGLVGQAAIGDEVEAAARPERARRGGDDALAERRLGGAAGMERWIADDGVVDRGRCFDGEVEPVEGRARIGKVDAGGLERAMLGIDEVNASDAA